MDKDIIAQARRTNLVEYFSKIGYQLEPVKSNRGIQYKVEGFGGLYVKDNMFYRFSDEKHGNSIECLIEVLNYSFQDAVKSLTNNEQSVGKDNSAYTNERNKLIKTMNEMGVTHFKGKNPYTIPVNELQLYVAYLQDHKDEIPLINDALTKKVLVMPEKCANVSRVYAYLIKSRGIEQPLVAELLQNRMLYQDKNGNAIFVHRDKEGNKIGGEVQGTSTSQRFKGIVTGTGISAFEIKRGTPDKVYAFESSIDMLSFMQMNKQITNAIYSSLAGLKKEILYDYHKQGLEIISMVDNDPAGEKFNASVKLGLFAQSLYEDYQSSGMDINYEINSVKDIPYAQFSLNGNTQFYLSSDSDINKFLDTMKLSGADNNPSLQVFIIKDRIEGNESISDFNYKGVSYCSDIYSNFKVCNDQLRSENVKDWNDLLKKNQPDITPSQSQQKNKAKDSVL